MRHIEYCIVMLNTRYLPGKVPKVILWLSPCKVRYFELALNNVKYFFPAPTKQISSSSAFFILTWKSTCLHFALLKVGVPTASKKLILYSKLTSALMMHWVIYLNHTLYSLDSSWLWLVLKSSPENQKIIYSNSSTFSNISNISIYGPFIDVDVDHLLRKKIIIISNKKLSMIYKIELDNTRNLNNI